MKIKKTQNKKSLDRTGSKSINLRGGQCRKVTESNTAVCLDSILWWGILSVWSKVPEATWHGQFQIKYFCGCDQGRLHREAVTRDRDQGKLFFYSVHLVGIRYSLNFFSFIFLQAQHFAGLPNCMFRTLKIIRPQCKTQIFVSSLFW